MWRKALAFSFTIILIFSIQGISSAQPTMGTGKSPPIVNANEMQVNASISLVNQQLWASVDAQYSISTIYGLGQSYSVKYNGDNGDFNVVTNKLEAHYPIPLSTKNISVEINNQEQNWQIDNNGFCHIFDSNLPEINWTIQPVPSHFTITVHYEEPIPSTTGSTAYLGQYALVFPLIPRFGSTDIASYPLYTWFEHGTTVASFTIQSQPDIYKINANSIDLNGSLSKMTYSIDNMSKVIEMQISGNNEQAPFPYGAVITMNAKAEQEPFSIPSIIIASFIAIAIIVTIVGMLLFRRHRKTTKLDGAKT
jgi:hypothetical protein